MRNAAVNGAQALGPVEFPYTVAKQYDWSTEYPDYKERTSLIGKWVKRELAIMIEYDAKAASSGSRTLHPASQTASQAAKQTTL